MKIFLHTHESLFVIFFNQPTLQYILLKHDNMGVVTLYNYEKYEFDFANINMWKCFRWFYEAASSVVTFSALDGFSLGSVFVVTFSALGSSLFLSPFDGVMMGP